KDQVLTPRLHHLRAGGEREWSDFPAQPEGPSLSLRFQAKANVDEWSLRLRQQDVRQTWKVLLNGKELGRLVGDENDMVIGLPIPAGRLLAGENTLVIEQNRQGGGRHSRRRDHAARPAAETRAGRRHRRNHRA